MALSVAFKSEEELLDAILSQELACNVKFVRQWKRMQNPYDDLQSLTGYKVRFNDVGHPASLQAPIKYDGVPFIIVGTDIYECHQGPQHVQQNSGKMEPSDHPYGAKRRKKLQSSKKQNCPAQVRVRKIMKFPEYKVAGSPTDRKKRALSQKLKREFNLSTLREVVVYAVIAGPEDHCNHPIGELSGFTHPIDKRITQRIRDLALSGHRNVESVKLMLEEYVRSDIAPEAESSNRRFFPSNKDIRNHIYHAVVTSNLRCADEDQLELQKLTRHWHEENLRNKYFFRPASSSDDEVQSMLLVLQTQFQRKLLMRYGMQMVLMDATYKITKYEVPMYNLCVTTNVGFYVVGSFFVSKDSKAAVMEGLKVIQKWNPAWKPTTFLCDFDLREIGAIETTFKDSKVYLCDFHREQSWRKWMAKSGLSNKDEVLKQLREIASASEEAVFSQLTAYLKESPVYTQNAAFRNWFEKKWLNEAKRWVFCYRKDIFNIISTTNGIERQHRSIKHQYLKEFGIGKSLCNVFTILVEKFFPDSEIRYKRANVASRSDNRQYNTDVPRWLEDRPKQFIKHCLDRFPPAVSMIRSEDIIEVGDCSYIVTSQDSQKKYTVSVDRSMPHCTCEDFVRRNWPCKHILALHRVKGMIGCLEHYFSSPIFTLDSEIFNIVNTDDEMPFETTPSDDDAEQEEITEGKARKDCLELVSQVESCLYNTDNIPLLIETRNRLQEVLQILHDNSNKVSGLPTRRTNKWRRRSVRKNVLKKSHPAKTTKRIAKEKDFISPVHLQQMPGKHDIEFNEFDGCLYEIWNMPPNDNQVLQVGPFIITNRSIHFIKTTLSDDVIDASLRLLLKDRNIFHIDCITATAIFQGQTAIHNNLPRENFNHYDACVGAISEGGNTHWSLMIIEPAKKLLTYLNPLGELIETCKTLCQFWYKFMNDRFTAGIENSKPDSWTLRSVEHDKQPDGVSCGVYVIKFAENYFNRRTLMFNWSPEDIEQERRKIALRILAAGSGQLSYESQPQPTVGLTVEDQTSVDILFEDQTSVEDQIVRDEPVEDQTAVKLHDDNAETFTEKQSPPASPVFQKRRLRNLQPKRKRSSFVYAEVKKNKRTKYCICNKPEDGGLYWQCEICEGWWHPSCLGLTEEPEHFQCDACKKPVEKNKSMREVKQRVKVSADDIAGLWKDIDKHLFHVAECTDDECEGAEHARHIVFIKRPRDTIAKERRKFGFGTDMFEEEAIEYVMQHLMHLIQFDRHPIRPATSAQIATVPGVPKSSKLYNIFMEMGLASNYVVGVLVKEALIYILCNLKTMQYELADEQCMKSEMDRKQAFGR